MSRTMLRPVVMLPVIAVGFSTVLGVDGVNHHIAVAQAAATVVAAPAVAAPAVTSIPHTQQRPSRQRIVERQAVVARANRVRTPATPRTIARQLAGARGWGKTQFSCLNTLWTNESGWLVNAANRSGAYGIPQAFPGPRMASMGSDWRTNPTTQIRWGLSYIGHRYGSPCDALAHWQKHNWY